MANVTVRNVSGTTIKLALHLDSALTSYTLASGATQAIDARCLDQAIQQGNGAPHNPLNAIVGDGTIPAKYAVIPIDAIA